ncbi:hypothetical protein ACFWYW_46430 [Nonomuraea sp. NPDC059023]|uniref:hypothetical protein n=1 Tax=unclassified Nonomuraea TaxID=2593643 RepID=UPI00368E5ED9
MSNHVKIKLAHPLRTEDAVELGLEERPYAVGSELTLPRAYADRLNGAGFVAGRELIPVAAAEKTTAPAAPVKPKQVKGGDEE